MHKLLGIPITKVLLHYGVPLSAERRERIQIPCPFHQETVPSFMVYLEDNHAYCFGCGKRFDNINLVREFEKCRFTEAVIKLGAIGGFILSEEDALSVRKEFQRGVEKLRAGKGHEYFSGVRHEMEIAFSVWLHTLPKRARFPHLIDYFWECFDGLWHIEAGLKELDETKDLLVRAEKFFMDVSLTWLFFEATLVIPREAWAERVGEDFGFDWKLDGNLGSGKFGHHRDSSGREIGRKFGRGKTCGLVRSEG